MEHILAKDLRESVLQYALEGKLTRHMETDSDIVDVLNEIEEQKKDLIKKKTIKKEQPLNSLQDDEIPFDIPDYWKWEKIGNLVDCGSGSTPLKGHPEFYTNGIIPWLKTGELTNTYITKCEDKITEEAFKKGSFRVNKPGDILIAMYGATIGKLGICTFDLTTNQACLGCTPYCGLNNMFLFYYFKATKNALIGKAEGGAQPNISRIKVRNHPIPLPPIEEQQRIVDKVDELMTKIDEYEKIENQLVQLKDEFPGDMRDAILQAAMQGNISKRLSTDSKVELCSEKIEDVYDTFDIPNEWSWVTIDSVIDVTTGLTFNKQDQCKKGPNTLRILRGGNVLDNYTYGLFDNDVYVSYREKYIPLQVGDVLSPAVTSMEKMCKVAYIDKELENTTAGGFVYILRSKNKKILNPRYMMYFFNSFFNRKNCNENIHKSGQAFYNLKKSGMITQPVPLPPIEEQQRIVDLLDKVLPLCDSLQS